LNIFCSFRKWKGQNFLSQLAAYRPGTINNLPEYVVDRWRKPGDIAAFQQYTQNTSSPAYKAAGILASTTSNGKYSDASFFRVKTIALSYDLPKKWMDKLKTQTVQIFVQGQNFFTITGFKGTDPENQNVLTAPPLKTINMGFNLNF
jgi:hypothetical protein